MHFNKVLFIIILALSDVPLTLEVMNSAVTVTEPDAGQETVVTACLFANVTETRKTDAVFMLVTLNSSTAEEGVDWYGNASGPYITIPAGFNGIFYQCIDAVVIGDNVIEEDEFFEIQLQTMTGRLTVVYSENGDHDALRVDILDNDGT